MEGNTMHVIMAPPKQNTRVVAERKSLNRRSRSNSSRHSKRRPLAVPVQDPENLKPCRRLQHGGKFDAQASASSASVNG